MDSHYSDDQENEEFHKLQGKYAQLKKRNISLQQRVDELETDLVERGSTIKKLSATSSQVKELQRQNQVLRLNLAAAEKKAARASATSHALDSRVEQMEKSYRERLVEIQTLLSKLEEVNGVVQELQSSNMSRDEVVQNLEQKYVENSVRDLRNRLPHNFCGDF